MATKNHTIVQTNIINWSEFSRNSKHFHAKQHILLGNKLYTQQSNLVKMRYNQIDYSSEILLPKVNSLCQWQFTPIIDSTAHHKEKRMQKSETQLCKTFVIL